MDTNKRITIEDIAKELGYSKTTISRALSGKGRISQETRNKITDYIKDCNYKPNVMAKGLAQSKTFNIGMVLPADTNLIEIPFFQSCLIGICEMASSVDYDVVVITVEEDDINQLIRVVNNRKVDAVILTRSLLNDLPATFLKSSDMPFVVIGSSDDENIIQIDNNHTEACEELTSLLIMQGMERIALIGGNMDHIVSRKRYNGYEKSLIKYGMAVNNNIIHLNATSKILIEKAVDDIMRAGADCILCMDDMICSHVLRRLNEDGYSIPDDIKVASFYNSAFLENHNPPITSVQFNVRELGVAACRVLLEYIQGVEVKNKTRLGYELVIKDSTKKSKKKY